MVHSKRQNVVPGPKSELKRKTLNVSNINLDLRQSRKQDFASFYTLLEKINRKEKVKNVRA